MFDQLRLPKKKVPIVIKCTEKKPIVDEIELKEDNDEMLKRKSPSNKKVLIKLGAIFSKKKTPVKGIVEKKLRMNRTEIAKRSQV